MSDDDIVSRIGTLGAKILAAKVTELRLRQAALEAALDETMQALHLRCHLLGNHIGEWRDCWSEPCANVRTLMEQHVEVPLEVHGGRTN